LRLACRLSSELPWMTASQVVRKGGSPFASTSDNPPTREAASVAGLFHSRWRANSGACLPDRSGVRSFQRLLPVLHLERQKNGPSTGTNCGRHFIG
jgi:hypothetical protein